MPPQWQWTETKLFTLSRVLTWGLTEYLTAFLGTQVEDWATEDREEVAVATMMVWIQRYRTGAFTEATLRELLELSLRQYAYSHRLRYVKLKPQILNNISDHRPPVPFLIPLLTCLVNLAPPQVADRISDHRFGVPELEKISREQVSMLRLSPEELLELGGYISSLAYREWGDPSSVVELRNDDF